MEPKAAAKGRSAEPADGHVARQGLLKAALSVRHTVGFSRRGFATAFTLGSPLKECRGSRRNRVSGFGGA